MKNIFLFSSEMQSLSIQIITNLTNMYFTLENLTIYKH